MGNAAGVQQQASAGPVCHVFISHKANESKHVFQALLMQFASRGLRVFNPDKDLQGSTPTKDVMTAVARNSKVLLALLSPSFFNSEWCRAEVEAAAQAGVPIIPVYAGSAYSRTQIMQLKQGGSAAVNAAFRENLIDVHNTDHPAGVLADIENNIINRFLSAYAGPSGGGGGGGGGHSWVGSVQNTNLQLVPRGSPEAVVLQHYSDISRGMGAPLTLTGRFSGRAIEDRTSLKNVMNWKFYHLGGGGLNPSKGMLHGALDGRGMLIAYLPSEGIPDSNDHKWTFGVQMNNFTQGGNIIRCQGKTNIDGFRSFFINNDGTIGIKKNPNLVVGLRG